VWKGLSDFEGWADEKGIGEKECQKGTALGWGWGELKYI